MGRVLLGTTSSSVPAWVDGIYGLLLGLAAVAVIAVVIWALLAALRGRGQGEPAAPADEAGLSVSDPAEESSMPGGAPGGTDLLAQARQTFLIVHRAESTRQPKDAMGYLSAALYLPWAARLDEAIPPATTSSVTIDSCHVYESREEGDRKVVGVWFDTTVQQAKRDKATGAAHGKATTYSVTEFWTFERSSGATPEAHRRLVARACPPCGAPLNLNARGECPYCSATVTSGDFDWVVTHIGVDNDEMPKHWHPHVRAR